MLQAILNRLRYKEYAVFFDEKGLQKSIKKIPSNKDNFSINNKKYFKGRDKYNHFTIMNNFKYFIYYFYEEKYAEPLTITSENLFKNISGEPFIAEHIQTVLDTKVLSDINRKTNNLFGGLDSKKLMIIGVIIVGLIYFLGGGTLT